VLVAADTRSALARAAASLRAEIVTPGDEPDTAGRAVDSLSATAPAVLLVDDAERFRDTAAGDTLDAVLNRRADIALVLATCPDDLAVAFRGLTARAREARCGVLLDPGPGDGAAFGIRIARRRGVARPGRGFVVGDPQWGEPFAAGPMPIQIALPPPATSEHRPGLIG
jgi:hypothetical protein